MWVKNDFFWYKARNMLTNKTFCTKIISIESIIIFMHWIPAYNRGVKTVSYNAKYGAAFLRETNSLT